MPGSFKGTSYSKASPGWGLETLEIRMKKHSDNALKLAEWLESREEVNWVNYPGLESSNYKSLTDKYLPDGQSRIVTFGVKGGYDSTLRDFNSTPKFGRLRPRIFKGLCAVHDQPANNSSGENA